jgi:hypothetical protein
MRNSLPLPCFSDQGGSDGSFSRFSVRSRRLILVGELEAERVDGGHLRYTEIDKSTDNSTDTSHPLSCFC